MATKRKSTMDPLISAKRSRHDHRAPRNWQPQPTGQPSVFAVSADDSDESDPAVASTREAMEYLRTVRSEADNIPDLLIAPSGPSAEHGGRDAAIYNSGRGDSRGAYHDGVYRAAPVLGPQLPPPSIGVKDPACNDNDDAVLYFTPQQACTRRYLALFKRQRMLLAQTPPSDLRLPESMKPTLPRGYQAGYRAYKEVTINHNPLPVYLSALPQCTVRRMLGYATEGLKRDRNIGQRQAAWLWGLLCRLEDVGTMDSDAVSIIRELGKKAMWVGLGFFDKEAAELTAEYSGVSADSADEDCDENGSEAMDLASLPGSVESGPEDLELEELKQRRRRNTSSAPSSDDGHASPPSPGVTPSASQVEAAALEAARARLLGRIDLDDSADADVATCDGCEEPVGNPAHDYADGREQDQVGYSDEPNADCPDNNTRAALDMVITISGEVYGQRDLLEFREVWGDETGLWG